MKGKKFDSFYLSYFCMELSLIMKAGISIAEGIRMIGEDEDTAAKKEMFEKVGEKLDEGKPLSECMEETGYFPEYFIQMIRIGEKTGYLEKVFLSLAQYYEREDGMTKRLRHAVTYPVVLFFLMLLVVLILIIKVLPLFNYVFIQLGSQMPFAATFLMETGIFLQKWWLPILGVIIIGLLFLRFINQKKYPDGGSLLQQILFRKKTRELISSARFASAMSMAVSSGMDIESGLDMAMGLADSGVIGNKVELCKQKMKEGLSFSEALNKIGIFPKIYCRMISVGITAGALDTVMEEISRKCDEAAGEEVDSVIEKIEPTLVIILSVVTGLVLLAVMIPLMGIMASV